MRYSSLQTLLHACIEKQEDAWRSFIQKFDKLILGTASYYTTENESKDVVQIVYMKLLEEDCKRLKNFEGESEIAFKVYLKKITRYVCLAEWKKNQKHNSIELLESEQVATIPQPQSEGHQLLEEEWENSLMQLPPNERECIQWLKLGYTNREIAEMMGVLL